jgi:hypothetical protein
MRNIYIFYLSAKLTVSNLNNIILVIGNIVLNIDIIKIIYYFCIWGKV